jgi:hypothetical protein
VTHRTSQVFRVGADRLAMLGAVINLSLVAASF